MGKTVGDDISRYEELMNKSKAYLESKLFDGEYFIQNIQWTGLDAPDPVDAQSFVTHYTPEALKSYKKKVRNISMVKVVCLTEYWLLDDIGMWNAGGGRSSESKKVI